MAQDFSKSVLEIIKAKYSEVFVGNGRINLHKPPVTAQTVFGLQTANVTPLYEANKCIGARVYYMEPENTTLPTVSTTAPAADCDLGPCDGLKSDYEEYVQNIYIEDCFSVDEQPLCDNEFEFAEIVAFGLQDKLSKMAEALNKHIIEQLEVYAMTPTELPDGATLNGNIVNFPADDFKGVQGADLLADYRQLAELNDISSNYFIMNGNLFYNAVYLANYKQLNDNERSFYAQFTDGMNMYWDTRMLDQVIGTPTSFIIDPNMYASYFISKYPETLTPTMDEYNTQLFSVPLTYLVNANGQQEVRTLTFNNNGTQEPVMVDIMYQKKCDTGNTNDGRYAAKHTWKLLVSGMFDIAPSSDGASGIIEIQPAP